MSDTKEREAMTKIETLIDYWTRELFMFVHPDADKHIDMVNNTIAALRVQADQQAQPADQQTHGVEDSPEYKAGLAAGKASYARHYKCGCTAFPADAPAYCPIHSASQKEQGK